ncbi:MAG: 60S ribosomal protein L31 [Thaumarchaeota archaeon]|nr:60S ribosomal protein L31 [Candidatus Calditenuaceae archaeon]MDW8187066.1 50S ribosomal protein L31e [Nitrososphaerota archaeon]
MTEKRVELTLNLRGAYDAKRWRRSKRTVNLLRERAKRIAKVKNVVLDESLNALIWEEKVSHPPRKIRVVIERVDDETAEVKLPEAKG